MAMLRYNPGIIENLKYHYLALDTATLIDACNSVELEHFLISLKNNNCSLVIINSVYYEFVRTAKSAAQILQCQKFLSSLDVTIVPNLEGKFRKNENLSFNTIFSSFFSKFKVKGPSYTDQLLCFMLYVYRNNSVHLMTSNYNDIPTEIFNREELMVFEANNTVRTQAIYSLDMKKFDKILEKKSEFIEF